MIYRVLIVDDEPNLLHGLRLALHHEPYELVTESDPLQALERLKQLEIQVVVTDHRMAGMSGTDLLVKVRELKPHSTRFLMTGSPSLNMALDAINGGAVSRIFIKPFPAIILAKAIRAAMEHAETMELSMRLLEDAEHLSAVVEAIRREHPQLIEPLIARRTLTSGAKAAGEYFPQDPTMVLQQLRSHFT